MFYSPLLASVVFLREEGQDVPYSPLGSGQRTNVLIRDREVDIVQSAVSSNWNLRERGVEPLPVHFAQINRRDGFFLVAAEEQPEFEWAKLEGRTILADQGDQPLAMLKYALKHNGVLNKVKLLRTGAADYRHVQLPAAEGVIVASVGAAMPPVAFSSLCCSREYLPSAELAAFRKTFERAKEWVRTALPDQMASKLAGFFPGVAADRLVEAAQRYQALGCWEGGPEIPRDLYEQALNVFQSAGTISWRHKYEEAVAG